MRLNQVFRQNFNAMVSSPAFLSLVKWGGKKGKKSLQNFSFKLYVILVVKFCTIKITLWETCI